MAPRVSLRCEALRAFGWEHLEHWNAYISWTPPRRDDDKPQIHHAKQIIEAGRECLVVTNDNYMDHIREGEITQDWFDRHVVSYLWLPPRRPGERKDFMLNFTRPGDRDRMPCLQSSAGWAGQ